ncbi:unnamed protein product [Cylicocyclus nassatus]|uniref:DUF5641 domain-containing protein n=1 Tax=Cylicocyclus nassatus TaxID=53992 RepID=A0AA36GKT1_CYLNA|nr:unnamed protein product [Cylicocyclus nassatus]
MAAKTAKFLRSQCKVSFHRASRKTYVANRVRYIRRVLDELRADNIDTGFYYLNTDNNPADCATRGLTATELQDHLWWTGPSFFTTPSSQWPWKSLEPSVSSLPGAEAEELKAVTTSTNIVSEPYVSFVPFTRTNSYTKLVRVTAYVLKFLARVRHRVETRCHRELQDVQSILGTMDITPVVTPDDFTTAESLLIREHYREGQQELNSSYMKKFRTTCDNDGIIREDLDHFWQLWQSDYLDALAQRQIIRSNGRARSTWPLALILELHTSSDGNVRSAKIRTAKKKILERSINHLVPLEIVVDDDTIPERDHEHFAVKDTPSATSKDVNSCSLVSTTVNKVNQLSSIGLSRPRARTFYEGTIQLRRTYLYRVAIMKHSSSSLLSRTASSSAQLRSPSPLASTSSADTAASSSESVAQLIIFEARRLLAHCEDSLELRKILDDICKKQRDLQSRVSSDPNLRPLQPNPAPDAHAHAIPALQDVVEVLPHTVEELIAAQLRRVFAFITTSGCTQLEPQAADTTLLTPEQQRHIARIVFHMRKLAAVLDCANKIFLNTQTLLLRTDKASISYARYMAYIHVIQHIITGITVDRDIISEALLSHFFTRLQSFLDALVGYQISESVIMEKLMAASAAVAHATRLTRTLEYHQMDFVMTHLRQKALRWWQENYEEALHGPLTEDYLEIAHSEDPFAQRQKERFVRVEFDSDQPQVATIPAASNISAFSPGIQPMQTEETIQGTQAPQSPTPSPSESHSSPVIIPLTCMSTPVTELERNQSIPPVLSPQVTRGRAD